jgi:linoleoyl-CoA desaturase
VRSAIAATLPTHKARVTFDPDDGFHAELKRRVREELRATGGRAVGGARMYLKTAIILLWFGASYGLLIFSHAAWWQAGLLALSLVLAVAGMGFCIQHDANHGAYSGNAVVNRIMGAALDLLGASSYMWHWKHNIFHHTFTNIEGADHDLDAKPFGRLAPDQARYRPHRFQHIYLWGLYGFMLPKWHLVDDFQNVIEGRIEDHRFPRPQGWALVQMLVGKAVFFTWALVIPMLFHTWWIVLAFYGVTAFMVGLLLAVVFQLAHCLEEADFPSISSGESQIADVWAKHQVRTTVDFARSNRLLTWYLGGLNYQVEHHLFPKLCHLNYPRISHVVEAVCAKYGVRYVAHDGMGDALFSHWRWLRRLGRPASLAGNPSAP